MSGEGEKDENICQKNKREKEDKTEGVALMSAHNNQNIFQEL